MAYFIIDAEEQSLLSCSNTLCMFHRCTRILFKWGF